MDKVARRFAGIETAACKARPDRTKDTSNFQRGCESRER